MTLGIIGVGSIAAAIVTGLLRHGSDFPVVLSPRGQAISSDLAAHFPAARVATDNQAVVDQSGTILVSVRPRDAEAVLSGLRFRPEQTVISAMAGVRLAALASLVGPATPIRVIPLPAIADGKGPTPIYPPSEPVRLLFDGIGGGMELDSEEQFDAFSAVTGTIAAYIDHLATIADWLASQGVAPAKADRYVAGMFSALDLSLDGTTRLGDLARHHTTLGGLNEAFANMLADAGVAKATGDGLDRLLCRINEGPNQ